MRKVIKFGGTSVGTHDALACCVDTVRQHLEKSGPPVVVISAFKSERFRFTDELVGCAQKVVGEHAEEALTHLETIRSAVTDLMKKANIPEEEQVDALLQELEYAIFEYDGKSPEATTALIKSFGERITARVFARLLNAHGIDAEPFDAYDLGMRTTDEYDNAMVLDESYPEIRKNLKPVKTVPVITGFIGKNKKGEITTFQRSGSDYTATVAARALGKSLVDEVILYTDVDGLYSGNPLFLDRDRLKRNKVIGFDVAEEGAYQKVKIPPGAIQPLVRSGIDLTILPLGPCEETVGTVITEKELETPDIAFITVKTVHFVNFKSAEMATRAGYLARIFACAHENDINIDLLSTTSTTVGMSVETESEAKLETFVSDLAKIEGCDGVMVLRNYGQINIIGSGIIRNFTAILHEAVTVLKMYNITVDAISTGFGVNIGFILAPQFQQTAVDRLHYHLIEKERR